jgi:NADP-dependent 3-hydroxy acid dehydrogenase YdfG
MDLAAKTALVTGASGGIGSAVARRLAKAGVRLMLSGRDSGRLAGLVAELGEGTVWHASDLAAEGAEAELAREMVEKLGGCDLLIHSIGLFRGGDWATAPVADLDDQLRVNVRIPYQLTRELLPSLIERQGQVAFVNSSAGFHPGRGGTGAYAASKHALRALTDSLREEVNRQGVRVLSVFPGRTASEMQAEVHRFEGKPYDPARFLQPDDVASAIVHALGLPRSAEMTDLHLRPMRPMQG